MLSVLGEKWGNLGSLRSYYGSHQPWVHIFLCLREQIKLNQANKFVLLNEINSSCIQLGKLQRHSHRGRLNNSGCLPWQRGDQRGIWWRFVCCGWYGDKVRQKEGKWSIPVLNTQVQLQPWYKEYLFRGTYRRTLFRIALYVHSPFILPSFVIPKARSASANKPKDFVRISSPISTKIIIFYLDD